MVTSPDKHSKDGPILNLGDTPIDLSISKAPMLAQSLRLINIIRHVQEPIIIFLPISWALSRSDSSLLLFSFPEYLHLSRVELLKFMGCI